MSATTGVTAPPADGAGPGAGDGAGPGGTAPGGPGAPASGGPARSPAARGPIRRHRTRLIVVALVLIGALVFLLVEGLGSSLDYYDTVPQALAQRATLGVSTFRLEGVVVRGTVHRTARGADFVVSPSGRSHDQLVRVDSVGTPPQSFGVGMPVIVVGHFAKGAGGANGTASGASGASVMPTFSSNAIMVKHSADYVAQQPKGTGTNHGTAR